MFNNDMIKIIIEYSNIEVINNLYCMMEESEWEEIYGYLVDRDFIGTRRNTGECNREVYKKEHNKKIERRSWIKRLNDNGISVDITCEEFFYQLQETNKYNNEEVINKLMSIKKKDCIGFLDIISHIDENEDGNGDENGDNYIDTYIMMKTIKDDMKKILTNNNINIRKCRITTIIKLCQQEVTILTRVGFPLLKKVIDIYEGGYIPNYHYIEQKWINIDKRGWLKYIIYLISKGFTANDLRYIDQKIYLEKSKKYIIPAQLKYVRKNIKIT